MSASQLAMMQALAALGPKVTNATQAGRVGGGSSGSRGSSGSAGSPTMNTIWQAMLKNQGQRTPVQSAPLPPFNPHGQQQSQGQMGPQQPQGQMGPHPPAQQQQGPITTAQQNAANSAIAYGNTQAQRFRPGSMMGGLEGFYDAYKEKSARKKMTADQAIADAEQIDLLKASQRQRGESIEKIVLAAKGDPALAAEMGKLTAADPDMAQKFIEQVGSKFNRAAPADPALVAELMAAGFEPGTPEYLETYMKIKMKSGQTINVGDQKPSPFESSMEALLKTGKTPVNKEAWLAGDTSEGVMDLTDVGKKQERRMEVIGSAAMVTDRTQSIRDILDDPGGILPTTGAGGAIVRKATDMLDPPSREGDKSRFAYFTNAGEIDAILEPIKAKIGLQTINQMRQMSATGGALGNVSNFEVRMVQAALDALEPGRSEEGFRSALDNVDTAFKRAAFFAQHGQDMVDEANKSGKDPVEYINKELNKRFPLNDAFFKAIERTPIPWEADGSSPEQINPGETRPIDTDNDGWSIEEN